MFILQFVIISLEFINIVFCYTTNEDKSSYNGIPSIFHIDDYESCKNEKKLFCKVTVILNPSNKNFTQQWKLIQQSIEDTRAYNHNELFHAICVQNFCSNININENIVLGQAISQCYKDKYRNLGLSAEITYLKCGNFDQIHKPGVIDVIWLLCTTTYISYIFLATYWDYKHAKNCIAYDKVCIVPFSLIRNFEKFKIINANSDFQKLKCMQGIRFYNMLLIIFCHTYSSYVGGYVMNTEYIENIPQNAIRLGMRNLMVFLVQTFFLFSAFLMSYHFFQLMENRNFHPKVIWLAFINRYLRIIPSVIVMISMGSTMWVISLFYGPIKDLYSDLEYYRCQKSWWASLLFINNHYNLHDVCYFTTWYLAADTQLYLLSLIVLSIIWKNKRNVKRYLSTSIVLGIFIPVIICYIYHLDIIYRLTPENSKNNQFRSFKFNAIYSSAYANMASYMVGLSFGYLYFKLRKSDINPNKVMKLLWFTFFLGLPLLVVFISSYYYSRFVSAILCGILKPLYAVGIAVGIFGMSRGLGGIIKTICEWKPVLVLGNLTFSTYMVHYGIVFYRTATATEPMYLSDFIMIKSFVIDVFISYVCGFLVHIFLEIPAANMQSLCIPQVRNLRTSTDAEKIKL